MITIREQILRDIQTTCENMSISNGYDNDYKKIFRFMQPDDYGNGIDLSRLPAIVITATGEEKEDGPLNKKTCSFYVSIEVVYSHDYVEHPLKSTDEILNSFLGDLEKAVMKDRTRGGYALNTYIERVDFGDIFDGAFKVSTNIDLKVLYRHIESDPSVKG